MSLNVSIQLFRINHFLSYGAIDSDGLAVDEIVLWLAEEEYHSDNVFRFADTSAGMKLVINGSQYFVLIDMNHPGATAFTIYGMEQAR